MTAADYAARILAERLDVIERLIQVAEAALPNKEPTDAKAPQDSAGRLA